MFNLYRQKFRFPVLLIKCLLIFFLALTIRLAYLSLITPISLITPDSSAYKSLAEEIINGQPYGSTAGTIQGGFPADLQRPPGYPFFIYLVSLQKRVDVFQLAVIQSFLSSLFAGVLCFSVSRLTTPQIGFMSGFFYAIDWLTIIHTSLLMTDILYGIVITGCTIVWCYYFSYQKLFFLLSGGVLLGIAALIKPSAQFIIIPLLIVLAIQPRRRFISILLLLMMYTLLTVPWMIRNKQEHGIFTLSSIGAVSLSFYVAEGALAGEQLTLMNTSILDERMVKKGLYWNTLKVLPPERKKMMEEEAWSVIRSHWFVVIKQSLQGLIRTCIGTGSATFKNALAHNPGQFQLFLWGTLLPLFQVVLYWTLAAYGLFRVSKNNIISKPALSFIVLTLIFLVLPSAMPLGYARFRTHAVPLICVLAAIGVANLVDWLKSSRSITGIAPEIL